MAAQGDPGERLGQAGRGDVGFALLGDQRPAGAQLAGQLAGTVAGHRQPGALRRSVGGEAAEDGDGVRSAGRDQCPQVAPPVGFGRQEMEDGAVVPDVEAPGRLPRSDIGGQPVHLRGLRAEPPAGVPQAGRRDVEHGHVAEAPREQGSGQGRCPAADVDQAVGGGDAGRVEHPQRHPWNGLEPAAGGIALGVDVIPACRQVQVLCHLAIMAQSPRGAVRGPRSAPAQPGRACRLRRR